MDDVEKSSEGGKTGGGTPPILVLAKMKQILQCFSIDEPILTLREITKRTKLPASTSQRLVHNLLREGFLDRDRDGYRIGMGMVRWAAPGTAGLSLVRKVRPALYALRDATGETACLYVRDGALRTVVSVAQTRHAVMRYFAIGMVMPMHAGAGARIFLAYDPQARTDMIKAGFRKYTELTPLTLETLDREAALAREQGYFATMGEVNDGVVSICAPVFSHSGELAAVIGLGAPAVRVTPNDFPRLAPAVMTAAAEASMALGYSPGQGLVAAE